MDNQNSQQQLQNANQQNQQDSNKGGSQNSQEKGNSQKNKDFSKRKRIEAPDPYLYLENIKQLNKVKSKLNYLEDLQSDTLSNITRLYRELGFAEAKIKWKAEYEESTNPQDFKFFLNEHPHHFFDPNQFKQVDTCLAEIRERHETLGRIEEDQRKFKLMQKELMPEHFMKAPKPKGKLIKVQPN